MKIVSAEEIRQLDVAAIERYGVAGLVLMENAGRQTVACLTRYFGEMSGKKVGLFAGSGNNGGDGLVIARLLHRQGAVPMVFLLARPEGFRGEAAVCLAAVRKLGLPVQVVETEADLLAVEQALAGFDLVVDALLGTGLGRPVEGLFAEVIDRINRSGRPVVAVDIPSGLDADTGQPQGRAVRADLTVTFAMAKAGQLIWPGRDYVGALEVVDIGIPAEAVAEIAPGREFVDRRQAASWLPGRPAAGHKGTFGHLLILAGSRGRTGAATLAGRGALRSGVGLVTLCVPADLNPVFEVALVEAMTVPLPRSAEGFVSGDDAELVISTMAGKQAMVIGPGLGTAGSTSEAVFGICRAAGIPLVIDADGLNIVARDPAVLREAAAPVVLTPHPGEMARLAGISSAEVQADRQGCARQFAEQYGVTVILKGAGSIIAGSDGRTAVCPTGNPGLAAGGTGDVLAGLIGGLLAQGLSAWSAAGLGVYAHGLAGDRLADRYGIAMGLTAGELADELPAAFGALTDQGCRCGRRPVSQRP